MKQPNLAITYPITRYIIGKRRKIYAGGPAVFPDASTGFGRNENTRTIGMTNSSELTAMRTPNTFAFWCGERCVICIFMIALIFEINIEYFLF